MILNINFVILPLKRDIISMKVKKSLVASYFPLEINGKHTFYDKSITENNIDQIKDLLLLANNKDTIINNVDSIQIDNSLDWSKTSFYKLLDDITDVSIVEVPNYMVEDYINEKSYELYNKLFSGKSLALYIGKYSHYSEGGNDIISFSVFLNNPPSTYIDYIIEHKLYNTDKLLLKNAPVTDCSICKILESELNMIEKDSDSTETIYPFNNEKVKVLAKYYTLKPYNIEDIIVAINGNDNIALPNDLYINKNTDLYNLVIINFILEDSYNKCDSTFTEIYDFIYNELKKTSLKLGNLEIADKRKLADIMQDMEIPAIYKNNKFYRYTIALDSNNELSIKIDNNPIDGVIYWRYYSKDAIDYVDLYDSVASYAKQHNISEKLAEKLNHIYML